MSRRKSSFTCLHYTIKCCYIQLNVISSSSFQEKLSFKMKKILLSSSSLYLTWEKHEAIKKVFHNERLNWIRSDTNCLKQLWTREAKTSVNIIDATCHRMKISILINVTNSSFLLILYKHITRHRSMEKVYSDRYGNVFDTHIHLDIRIASFHLSSSEVMQSRIDFTSLWKVSATITEH